MQSDRLVIVMVSKHSLYLREDVIILVRTVVPIGENCAQDPCCESPGK